MWNLAGTIRKGEIAGTRLSRKGISCSIKKFERKLKLTTSVYSSTISQTCIEGHLKNHEVK